jgi:hypothetical protein
MRKIIVHARLVNASVFLVFGRLIQNPIEIVDFFSLKALIFVKLDE